MFRVGMRMPLVVVVVCVLCGLRLARGGRFAYLRKRFLQGRHVGLVGIESNGYRLLLHVELNIFHPLLEGNVLHDFVAAALAMQVAIEDNGLFVRLGLDSHHRQECQQENKKLFHKKWTPSSSPYKGGE